MAASARFTACLGRSGTNYRQARQIIAFAAPNSLLDKEKHVMGPGVGPVAVPMDIETAKGHWRDGKWIDFDPVAPPGAEVGGSLASAQPQPIRK